MKAPNSADAHAHHVGALVRELLLQLRAVSCIAESSLCSMATIGSGVPAGATRPIQLAAW